MRWQPEPAAALPTVLVLLAALWALASCGSAESTPSSSTAVQAEAEDDASVASDSSASESALDEPSTCDVESPGRDSGAGSATLASMDLGLRPDLQVSGNRLVPGASVIGFDQPTVIDLPENPQWVLSGPSENAGNIVPDWIVVLESGAAVAVAPDGRLSPLTATHDEGPPVVVPGESLSLAHLGQEREAFNDPLPDTRVVESGRWAAALVGPTGRYGHGVLGDKLEAGGVELIDRCADDRILIEVDPPDVIEGLAPLLVDAEVSPTGDLLVLVTVSNADDGARLVTFDSAGNVVAESEPIGSGNRWRNQLAAGPVGPGGSFAVVDVRTPHIDGTVQWFALDTDRATLKLVSSSEPAFTTHAIGSRNLDLGAAVDVDGDGRQEIVVPSAQRNRLTALRPGQDDGHGLANSVVVATAELSGRMTTNLGVRRNGAATALAVGIDGQQLLIFD